MCCVLTVSANVGILGVARFYASGAYFRSTESGSMDLFTKLLQQNAAFSCKDHWMPRAKVRKQQVGGSPGATAQVAAGGHSGLSSPSDGGPSSSLMSPSKLSDSSPSPTKGVRQQATRRMLLACAEGSSQPITAAHALTFARMSAGRAPPSKIPLIEEGQESVCGNRAPPAPPNVPAAAARNAASAGTQRGKTVPVPTNAEDMLGDDQ